jgi:hypothetical protein
MGLGLFVDEEAIALVRGVHAWPRDRAICSSTTAPGLQAAHAAH